MASPEPELPGGEPDGERPAARAAGILYSGSGAFYVGEAVRSARSSLRHNDVPHVVFADVEAAGAPGLTVSRFEPSGNPYADKIANMRRSPFERTLYLDSDTYVLDEIVHVLALLDHYDLAVAFAPGYRGLEDPAVPKGFHEFNTGVLAWRRSERTDAFLASWQETYEAWLEHDAFLGARAASLSGRADQPAFRRCAWEHELSVFVLPAEYNFRLGFPATVVDRVRVIHGEHPDLEALGRRLNAVERPRSWPPPPTFGERARRRLRRSLGRPARVLSSPRTVARDARQAERG